jgi:hypothetical protein
VVVSKTNQQQERYGQKHAPPKEIKCENADGADFDVLVPDKCPVLHPAVLVGFAVLQDEQHS